MLFPSESPPSLSFVSLPCGSSPPLCWRVLGRNGKQGLVCGFSGLRQAFRVGAVSRLSASASISPLARSSSLPLHHFNVQVRIQEIPQDVRTLSKAESDVEGGLGRRLGPLGLGWWEEKKREERGLRAQGDLGRERECSLDCQQSARPAWPPNSAFAFLFYCGQTCPFLPQEEVGAFV